MLSSIRYLTSYELMTCQLRTTSCGLQAIFYELLYPSGELRPASFNQDNLQDLECGRLSDLFKITLANSEATIGVISLSSYKMPKGRVSVHAYRMCRYFFFTLKIIFLPKFEAK